MKKMKLMMKMRMINLFKKRVKNKKLQKMN